MFVYDQKLVTGHALNRRYMLALAAVLLAITVAYANSFENSFHFDDYHTVVDNPAAMGIAASGGAGCGGGFAGGVWVCRA